MAITLLQASCHNCLMSMYHTGPPPPPDVEFIITSYSVENFTTCLTWQSHKSDMYYLINTSRSDMRYNETSTEICLIAEYNTPLQVSVVTVNCAGKSEPVTSNISIGMALTDAFSIMAFSLSLSWLWSSQSTSQWQCW